MEDTIYTRLIDSLNMRGGAVLPIKCPEFYSLLRELFTAEEADLFTKMPFGHAAADEIARAAQMDTGQADAILDRMAGKGLIIYSYRDGGRKFYKTLTLVPGIFEYQFLKGETGERDKKIARLFHDYFHAMSRHASPSEGARGPSVPFSRVIPVEEDITANTEVLPYELLMPYLETTDCITVSTCYCRHHADLIGEGCGKIKDVCLSLGHSARFAIEKGFGRQITPQEAKEILRRSEEAGLVHIVSNTSKRIDFICNCCVCHCGPLRSMKMLQEAGGETMGYALGANSSYIVQVDQESCQGCGTCVERCPMEALSLKDDMAERDSGRCIGCGLCVSVCPTESLEMVLRADRKVPPKNNTELLAAMIDSMQQS
ncbi:MAG: 4Fe-4S binding protein [Deltaproteobacteria bacterium]|nr:4Fe-4S binding protein [Deltaproteobacteria bacterium]